MADSNIEMNVFWEKNKKSLEKRSKSPVEHQNWCIEWTGSVDKQGYGVKWVKWPGGESMRVGTHRLAWMVAHRIPKWDVPQVAANGERMEVSHLCHNKICLRESHLVLEPHSANMERAHCAVVGACTEKHSPRCLFLD